MTGPYAMGRLLWRPAAWLILLALAMVALGAGWDLAQGPSDLIGAAIFGDSTPDLHLALWRLTTLLPAVAGLVLSFSSRELQHTVFAWTLPGLASGLRAGKLLIGLVMASLLALVAVRMRGPGFAPAAFGWALLSFGAGGAAFDPALSKLESRGIALIVALLVFRPMYLEQLITLQPLLVGAISAAVGVAMLRREFSRAASRKRPFAAVSALWATTHFHTRQYWTRHARETREWGPSLATDNLVRWIRAGHYEGFGARGSMGKVMLWQLAVCTTAAYLSHSTSMVVLFPWLFLGMSGLQVHARFLYPLGRSRRANLHFASSLVESVAAIAAGIAGLGALFLIGYDFGSSGANEHAFDFVAYLIFFTAWAPLIHWAKIHGPYVDAGSMTGRRAFRFFGYQMGYISLGMISMLAFRELTPAPATATWLGVAVLIATTHAAYWIALSHHYRTRDLIVARA